MVILNTANSQGKNFCHQTWETSPIPPQFSSTKGTSEEYLLLSTPGDTNLVEGPDLL